MCGIFGVFYTDRAFEQAVREVNLEDKGRRKVVPHEELLALLAPPNLKRGNKAFGYFAWREDLRWARRWTTPYNSEAITALRMKSIIVHNRAPTDGDACNTVEVHPYSTKYGELFMNGILLNHLDGQFDGRRTHASRVDTAYLAGNIDHWVGKCEELEPWEDCLARAVGEFKGQQACVFIEPRWGSTYIWRVMSTLFFGGHRRSGYSVISSVAIPGLCEEEVPQGTIFSVDRNHCSLLPRAEFAYESIYEASEAQS